jgi:hypothetical protein
MLAANELGHDVLSGYFLAGFSHQREPGWREYLLTAMSQLEVTDDVFRDRGLVTIREEVQSSRESIAASRQS